VPVHRDSRRSVHGRAEAHTGKDGYSAVQVGFGERRTAAPDPRARSASIASKAGKMVSVLREFRDGGDLVWTPDRKETFDVRRAAEFRRPAPRRQTHSTVAADLMSFRAYGRARDRIAPYVICHPTAVPLRSKR